MGEEAASVVEVEGVIRYLRSRCYGIRSMTFETRLENGEHYEMLRFNYDATLDLLQYLSASRRVWTKRFPTRRVVDFSHDVNIIESVGGLARFSVLINRMH